MKAICGNLPPTNERAPLNGESCHDSSTRREMDLTDQGTEGRGDERRGRRLVWQRGASSDERVSQSRLGLQLSTSVLRQGIKPQNATQRPSP